MFLDLKSFFFFLEVTFLSSAYNVQSLQNNSVFPDLLSDEVDMLYSAYGDDAGVQCALRWEDFALESLTPSLKWSSSNCVCVDSQHTGVCEGLWRGHKALGGWVAGQDDGRRPHQSHHSNPAGRFLISVLPSVRRRWSWANNAMLICKTSPVLSCHTWWCCFRKKLLCVHCSASNTFQLKCSLPFFNLSALYMFAENVFQNKC